VSFILRQLAYHTQSDFLLTIQATNDPPAPGSLTISAKAGVPKKFPLARILAVASDAQNDLLAVTSVNPASAKGVRARTDGLWVIYEPPPGATFPDTITYFLSDGHSVVPGAVEIQEAALSSAPTQNLLRLQVLPKGDIQLDFVGVPRYTYRVQACSNLAAPVWQDLGSVTADRYGRIKYTDVGGAYYPVRYYRTAYP